MLLIGLLFSGFGGGVCYATYAGPVDEPPLMNAIIMIVLFVIGLPLFFLGVSGWLRKWTIRIANGQLTVTSAIIFSREQYCLPVDEITGFAVLSTLNSETDFQIDAQMARGQSRRLVCDRGEEELQWLAEQLNRVVNQQRSSALPEVQIVKERPEPDLPGLLAEERSRSHDHHFLPRQDTNLAEEMKTGVACQSCDSLYRVADMRLSCGNCGAALSLSEDDGVAGDRQYVGTFPQLEKLLDMAHYAEGVDQVMFDLSETSSREMIESSVTCGWCDAHYTSRPESSNCEQCGGVLPALPSLELGPAPPAGRRRLPLGFVYRLTMKLNRIGWLAIIGVAVAVALVCWQQYLYGLLVAAPSLALAYVAFARPLRRFLALRYGLAVPGRIESVHELRSNGPHTLRRMYYRFSIDGKPVRGVKWSYSPAIGSFFVGEPVWVVYLPWHQAANDLWPPFN